MAKRTSQNCRDATVRRGPLVCDRPSAAKTCEARPRSGFTLLEVILATGLSVVLLGLLSLAIQLYVHSADIGRTEVVNAALARNLLRTIADDLRRTVFASPTTAGSQSRPSSGEGSGGTDTNDESDAPAEDETQGAVPGLYGNQYELQVDISRVPRIDEYEALLAAGTAQSSEVSNGLTAGLTTVAYYVVGETSGQSSTELSSAPGPSGLYRRSLSRTVSQWAMETADEQVLSGGDQLLAPEVAAIEFRYFDGLEWDSQWESDVRQGLPLAVEILLHLIDESSVDRSSTTTTTLTSTTVHRLVVPLPLARPTSTTTGLISGGSSL